MPQQPDRPGGSARTEQPRPWDVPVVEGGSAIAVPDAVRDAALRAFSARSAGSAIADLVFDSLLDYDPAEAFQPDQRRLVFDCADGGARLAVVDAGQGARVQLQTVPPRRATVEVRCSGPTFEVTTDQSGSVLFDVPLGLVSVVITPVGDRPVQTAWVRL